MKITLVILTYNEVVGLREMIPRIPVSSVDEILAIDGGSTDGTIALLKEHRIPVYSQTVKGRGEAFRVAFRKASGDALILFSPDGNEDPNDIPKFRPYLEDGFDLVIASRMRKGAHNEEDTQTLRWRKWVNNAFTLLANVLWNRRGPYVTDTINGFRAISKSTWETLAPDGPGYTIEFQTSIRALKRHLRIAEFPTWEGERIDARAGSPSFQTGVAFCKSLFREIVVGRHWEPLNS